MKKGLRIFLVAAASILAVACSSKGNSSSGGSSSGQEVTKYHVTFDLNGGSGQAPVMQDKEEGAKFNLPSTDATKEGFDFGGWNEGENLYAVGIEFTMPARDVSFIAKWNEHIEEHVAHPHFTQESYTYDKLAGEDLELPLDLDGASFYYLEIDENAVPYAQVSYNDSKQCVVVAEEYVLNLELGQHDVKAITDGDEEPATCKLVITNSVTTSFDEVTEKEFKLGYQEDVRFSITLNGTTIRRLTCRNGELTVDPSFYRVENNELIISGDWLRFFYLDIDFEVVLSNNDKYQFTINTNSIFYTDYDVTTIHSTVESNIGHNPLYQYYDNVSIENAPEGMSGKALKYVPNTVDVTYDCHCIYTIKTAQCSYMWYEAPFNTSKNYVYSFDYLTHNTTVGTFRFQQEGNAWGDDLLLGAENDDVVHHYSRFVKGSELGNGAMLKAFFKGGQGYIFVDNFRICEVEEAPVLDAGENYTYTNTAKDITVNLKGMLFNSVSVDGNKLASSNYEYKKAENKLTLAASYMESLEQGLHTVSINTPICSFETSFRCVRPIVCVFNYTEFNYDPVSYENAWFTGTFSSNLECVGLYQVDKVDQSYVDYGGWDFCINNTTKNYANCVTIASDRISISGDLIDKLYGTTQLRFEFNSGDSQVVTINSYNLMFSDYDNTTMMGYLNGGYSSGSPLNSGMWGSSVVTTREYEPGNYGLSVTSTEGSADQALFTTRFHAHPWSWYHVDGDSEHLYRVTFKYKLTNIEANSAYFFIMSVAENENALHDAFYGNYDQADFVSGDNYYKVRFNLIADGEFHTFDSGYFNFDPTLRMFQLHLPYFTASDNKEVLIDDFKLNSEFIDGENLEYVKSGENNLIYSWNSSNLGTPTITVNGTSIGYTTVSQTQVKLNNDELEAFSVGTYKFVADHGNGFKVVKNIAITDNRKATLTETTKAVTYKGGSVKLAGEFTPDLGIRSFKRLGDENWDNTNGMYNYQTSSDGTMDKTKLTVEADGLVVGQEIVDQVYGTMHYTVVFENEKTVTFDLTSNTIYYSNWNDTLVYREADAGQNFESCQDYSMSTWATVDGRRVLRYTPSNAVLGHALGSDNRICTFSVLGKNTWWWQWGLGEVTSSDKFYIEINYNIVGECDTFYWGYWDNDGTCHTTAMPKASNNFYLELDPTNISAFAIGCSTYGSASAGTYMDIYNICFGIK